MKKLILLSLVLFLAFSLSYGQIFTPGGAIAGASGSATNVGIGVAAPTSILHVIGGDVHFQDNNFRTGNANGVPGSLWSGALGNMNQVVNSQMCFALGGHHNFQTSDQSVILGEENQIINGHGSVAMGGHNFQDGAYTFTMGSNLNVTGGTNIALGSDLANNIPNSLMIGFNSNLPTLTVRQASGGGTTGKVGIGTSNPQTKLDVNGVIRASSLAGGGNVCADALGNLILSGPCGGGGDDLGNHTATMDLDMQCNNIINAGNISFCNGSLLDQSMPGELTLQGALTIMGPPGSTGFELFVQGNAFATGAWVVSDQRYKKDIRKVNQANDMLKDLNAYSYSFKQEENPDFNFPEGKVYGFMAQELAEVLPEAVMQTPNGLFTVNYDMVVPLLTEALKEQQATIESQATETAQLRDEIADLKAAVQSICNNGCGTIGSTDASTDNAPTYWEEIKLEQNTPNPFNTVSTIKYYLPEEAKDATLLIYDLQGRQIKKFELSGSGHGSVSINAGELQGGMYLYGLLVDGKSSATLKMILTE